MTETRTMALEVILSWGGNPQCTELYTARTPITVGEQAGADFALPREVLPEGFTLAEPEGDAWVLCLPAGATAAMSRIDRQGGTEIVDLGAVTSDAAGNRRVRIEHGSHAQIGIGAFTFHVRGTDPPERIAGGVVVDWRPWRFIGVSALFHGALLVTMMMSPPDATALSLDMNEAQRRFVEVHLSGAETSEPFVDDSHLANTEAAATNEGRPMDGDEGTAGARDDRRNTGGGVAVRGEDDEPAVPLTGQDVRDMSLFSTLASVAQSLSEVSSAYGDPNARGWSAESFYGPLMASSQGFGPGTDGFGMRGTGRGGCPIGATNCAAGTVGSGDFDTVGTSGGCSREVFARFQQLYGRAGAMDRCSGTSHTVSNRTTRLEREGGAVPDRIRIGVAEPVGALSREQIRRVVRRNIAQVRHCYEQGLLGQPDLAGRVSVNFIVAPTGAVSSSQIVSSDLGSARVESCVASSVRRWPFPAAEGVTAVTYPFLMQGT